MGPVGQNSTAGLRDLEREFARGQGAIPWLATMGLTAESQWQLRSKPDGPSTSRKEDDHGSRSHGDALEEHADILAVRNLAYATYGNCYARGGGGVRYMLVRNSSYTSTGLGLEQFSGDVRSETKLKIAERILDCVAELKKLSVAIEASGTIGWYVGGFLW